MSKRRTDDEGIARRLMRRLPGGTFAQKQIDKIEDALLGELKQRLDRIDPAPPAGPAPPEAAAALQDTMRVLLQHAADLTPEQSQQQFFVRLLQQLVPDEARLLAALADGTAYPMIHVMTSPVVGGGARRIVENVSNIGRAAGLPWLEAVPRYITHLRALDLVETGPEDPGMKDKYDMLEAETAVREALDHVNRSHAVRRTLKLSALGQALWRACGVATAESFAAAADELERRRQAGGDDAA